MVRGARAGRSVPTGRPSRGGSSLAGVILHGREGPQPAVHHNDAYRSALVGATDLTTAAGIRDAAAPSRAPAGGRAAPPVPRRTRRPCRRQRRARPVLLWGP